MPTMGLFRMALYDPTFPENGYSLVFFREGNPVNATALAMVKTDWSIVWQVWPFIVFGFLVGMTVGYPLGELVRRKYAIDQASRKAVLLGEALRDKAHRKERIVENIMKEAYDLEARVKSMQAELELERQEVAAKKFTAELYVEAEEGFRQRNVSLQKELAKAKAKILKLEERGGHRKAKPVDFAPWAD